MYGPCLQHATLQVHTEPAHGAWNKEPPPHCAPPHTPPHQPHAASRWTKSSRFSCTRNLPTTAPGTNVHAPRGAGRLHARRLPTRALAGVTRRQWLASPSESAWASWPAGPMEYRDRPLVGRLGQCATATQPLAQLTNQDASSIANSCYVAQPPRSPWASPRGTALARWVAAEGRAGHDMREPGARARGIATVNARTQEGSNSCASLGRQIITHMALVITSSRTWWS